MRNRKQTTVEKLGWACLLAGFLALPLGACRTQEGPIVQEKKENREQMGEFEIQGLEVRTFTGAQTLNVLQATSATLDLAQSLATLNQVGMHFTSETQEMLFRSGAGVFYTKSPTKKQVVPEYLPGARPRGGDVYLEGGVDINANGKTIKAPSLFYLNVPTGAALAGGDVETTVSIVSAGGDVELSMPTDGGGKVVIEAKGFKTNQTLRKIHCTGPLQFKIENSTPNAQNEDVSGKDAAGANELAAPATETGTDGEEVKRPAPDAKVRK